MPGQYQGRASVQLSRAVSCMKVCLMIFDFIIWIFGCVIVVVGLWVYFRGHNYLSVVDLNAPYRAFSPHMGIYIITFGAALAFIGLMACCCTYTGNTICLYIYAASLSVMLMSEICMSVAAFGYRGILDHVFQNSLRSAMQNYEISQESKDVVDDIQYTLQCCGMESYADWQYHFQKSVPDSCCKMIDCNTEITVNVNKPGCYSTVINFINTSDKLIGLVGLAVAFFQLFGIVMTCCLAHCINKAKYELMD